jgi:type I restriction enzyme S subunit
MKQYIPLGDLLESSDSGVWGDEDLETGISVLRSTNFNADGTLDLTKLTYRALDARDQSRKLLRSGDILLEKSGGGPKQPVGRVCLFRGDAAPHAFGNFIARLRPGKDVLSEYLFYYLWQFHGSGKTNHYQKQTTGIRNLEFKRYLTIPVPVRPITDQQQIVDQLSRAESIVRLRRQAQQKAAELIPAIFVDMFGNPETNPKGWPEKPVEVLCSVATGATPRRDVRSYYEGGTVPWVKTGEVSAGEIVRAEECITELAVSETNCKVFPAGTILIAMYGQGQTRGRAGMLKIPAATNQACAAILPSKHVNQAFLFEMLRMQYERLRAMGRGGNQANLNLGMIKTLRVPVPPLEAQRAFARHAEALQSIQSQQTLALQKMMATFEALLARAFAPEGAAAATHDVERAVS